MKNALCIGINYTGTEYELGGATNDAEAWAEMLETAGFNVAVMRDSAATKRNMICGIETIVTRLKPGDVGFVSFSGHGTWVPDLNGDEPDGRDEALCPIDCYNNVLIDDELHAIFDQIPKGTHVVFVADCCHAGSVFRMTNGPRGIGVPRFMPPSFFTHTEVQIGKLHLAANKSVTKKVGRVVDPLPGLVYFGACKDAEYSNDVVIAGRGCGAFSHFAVKSFMKALKGGLAYVDVHREVAKRLPTAELPQTPVLFATSPLKHTRVFAG